MSTTSDVRSGQNRKTVANKLAIIYLNIRNKQKRQLDALKAQAQNRFPQYVRKTIEAETQTRSFMWAPSPVSLSAKRSFFPAGWQAVWHTATKTLKSRGRLRRKASLQIICFTSTGLISRHWRVREQIWEQLRSWRFKGKSSDISLGVHLESQIYGLQRWVFMQQTPGEKDPGY